MTGLRKGARAYKKAKEEASSGRQGETFRFILKDGEEAPVRFLGMFREPLADKLIKKLDKEELEFWCDVFQARPGEKETLVDALIRRMTQEEPVIFTEHWINSIQWSHTCSNDEVWRAKGYKGCVTCYLRDQGGKWKKTLGYPRDQFAFSVFDYRSIHRVEKGDDTVYHDCTMAERDRCKWCKRASDDGPVHPAKHKGLRKWTMGRQRAASVMALNERLGKKCLFCNDKIRVVGWQCAKCNQEFEDIDADGVSVRCHECGHKGIPREILSHRKSKNDNDHDPVRGSLSDCVVYVSRSGSGKDDTVYSMEPDEFDEGMEPDILEKVGYIDWAKELTPPSTTEVAAKLGLAKDPFADKGGGVGGEDYDDDEEDEEDEEDED